MTLREWLRSGPIGLKSRASDYKEYKMERQMYVSPNFKTKKALKDAVKAGKLVTVYQPGLGPQPPVEGVVYGIEGPHAPEPHKWYAEVTLTEGIVIKVK